MKTPSVVKNLRVHPGGMRIVRVVGDGTPENTQVLNTHGDPVPECVISIGITLRAGDCATGVFDYYDPDKKDVFAFEALVLLEPPPAPPSCEAALRKAVEPVISFFESQDCTPPLSDGQRTVAMNALAATYNRLLEVGSEPPSTDVPVEEYNDLAVEHNGLVDEFNGLSVSSERMEERYRDLDDEFNAVVKDRDDLVTAVKGFIEAPGKATSFEKLAAALKLAIETPGVVLLSPDEAKLPSEPPTFVDGTQDPPVMIPSVFRATSVAPAYETTVVKSDKLRELEVLAEAAHRFKDAVENIGLEEAYEIFAEVYHEAVRALGPHPDECGGAVPVELKECKECPPDGSIPGPSVQELMALQGDRVDALRSVGQQLADRNAESLARVDPSDES